MGQIRPATSQQMLGGGNKNTEHVIKSNEFVIVLIGAFSLLYVNLVPERRKTLRHTKRVFEGLVLITNAGRVRISLNRERLIEHEQVFRPSESSQIRSLKRRSSRSVAFFVSPNKPSAPRNLDSGEQGLLG